MKRMLLLLLTLFTATACSDSTNSDDDQVFGPVDNFEEIQTQNGFKWSTEEEYELELIGLKTLPFSKQAVLEVSSLDGEVIHRSVVEASQNKTLKFKAVGGLDSLAVSFGSIFKEVDLHANRALFDFLPADDTTDLAIGN